MRSAAVLAHLFGGLASECPGTCIDASAACATGTLPGLCEGATVCCPASCSAPGVEGRCIDTSASACDTGATVGGLCPGSTAVRCCPERTHDTFIRPFPAAQAKLSLTYSKTQGATLGRNYTAHIAVLDDPRYFGINPQPGGCQGMRAPVSAAAEHYGCVYATNGGYFSYTAGVGCVGAVVANGTLEASPVIANRAKFALLTNGSYAVGFLDETNVDSSSQLIEGLGWIVRDGRPYSDESLDLADRRSIADAVTPRTAIGVTAEGQLLLAQTEGIEGAEGSEGVTGVTLKEFGALLVKDFNVIEAVNLDGGGSSDSVYNGEVIGNPTCHGTTEICEREVATITCVYATAINAQWQVI